ncbi:MAG: hypothetical protein K2Z80_22535 [Xanthobacteraceae bacterium]|nr:hypothetical protein [Xanthobacteraceae bacterium]
MMEFRSGGRRVSQKEFFDNLLGKAIDLGMQQIEERARGAASSIIDPETGKHAQVFVRRKDEASRPAHGSGPLPAISCFVSTVSACQLQ